MDRDQIRQRMDLLETEELQAIYREYDTEKYVAEVFEVVGGILQERGAEAPPHLPASDSDAVADRGTQGGFLSFQQMISVELIRGAYLLGALGLSVFGATAIFSGELGVGLLVVFGGNVLWRLVCEAGIVLFSMHELLASIDRKIG